MSYTEIAKNHLHIASESVDHATEATDSGILACCALQVGLRIGMALVYALLAIQVELSEMPKER